MLNEDEQQHISSTQSWLWSDCKLVLRRTNPQNISEESYENLQAQVQLECQQILQPFIPILTFDKPLKYDRKSGYYWKKGTPLPSLNVKLQQSYFQLLKQDDELIMIYCELTVAYPNRKQTHFYLQQIRSLGDKRKIFEQGGMVQFSGILLKESSIQKSNNKFSLVIKICASSIQENKIILKTLISTAFYVLNAKILRKTNKRDKYSMKLISPKRFMKPLNCMKLLQKDKYNGQEILRFVRNFNKNQSILRSSHPLYIIYHYSEILTLYYDSKQVTDLYELLDMMAADDIGEGDKIENMKSSIISYELKKTKLIKKNKNGEQKKMIIRSKLIIKTNIKKVNSYIIQVVDNKQNKEFDIIIEEIINIKQIQV